MLHDGKQTPLLPVIRHWEVLASSMQYLPPPVLALILSRFYLRERTCNAGIKLSMCSRKDFPFYYIAVGK